jgi:hypothetical protein
MRGTGARTAGYGLRWNGEPSGWRNQAANQPLVFRRSSDCKAPELMITNVTNNAVAGYLLLF